MQWKVKNKWYSSTLLKADDWQICLIQIVTGHSHVLGEPYSVRVQEKDKYIHAQLFKEQIHVCISSLLQKNKNVPLLSKWGLYGPNQDQVFNSKPTANLHERAQCSNNIS